MNTYSRGSKITIFFLSLMSVHCCFYQGTNFLYHLKTSFSSAIHFFKFFIIKCFGLAQRPSFIRSFGAKERKARWVIVFNPWRISWKRRSESIDWMCEICRSKPTRNVVIRLICMTVWLSSIWISKVLDHEESVKEKKRKRKWERVSKANSRKFSSHDCKCRCVHLTVLFHVCWITKYRYLIPIVSLTD